MSVNDIHKGFKTTELGMLPENWEIVRLGDIADIKYGKAKPKEPGDFPVYGSGGIYSYTDQYITDFDTLIIGRKGTAGRVFLVKENVWASDTTFYLKWKKDINVDFLYYFMSLNPLSGEEAKTTLPSIKKPNLENSQIAFPSPSEQKHIVTILSAVQEAIEKTEAITNAAREFKKSIMKHIFTYGPVSLEEAEKVELKETEIGEVPVGWEVGTLKEFCRVKGSSTIAYSQLKNFDTFQESDLLVHGIKVADMNLPRNETMIVDANIMARLPENVALSKTIPPISIIFPKRGAAIATNKKRLTTRWTVLDPNIIAVVPGPIVNPYYLFNWFLTFDITSIQSPGPTPQLNKKDVEPVQFPLPSLEEQKRIVETLSSIGHKIEAEVSKKAAYEELFKTLLNDIMTAKIRVDHLKLEEGNA